MTLSHPNIYQALECFGVGLLVIAGFVVLFAALWLVLKRCERPVEAWFLHHPNASKGVVIGGLSLMVSVCVFFVFQVGCYFGGH